MGDSDEDKTTIDSWLAQLPKAPELAEEAEPTGSAAEPRDESEAAASDAAPPNTWAELLDEAPPGTEDEGVEPNADAAPSADAVAPVSAAADVQVDLPPVFDEPEPDEAPTVMEEIPPSLLAEPAFEEPPLELPLAEPRPGIPRSRKLVIAVFAVVAMLAATLVTLVLTDARERPSPTPSSTGSTSTTSTTASTEEPDTDAAGDTDTDTEDEVADAAAVTAHADEVTETDAGFELEMPHVPPRIRRLSWRTRRRRARNHRIVALRLFGRMRYERAEEAWREALVYDPRDRYTAQGLARTLRALGREEEAAAWQARADGTRAGMWRRP